MAKIKLTEKTPEDPSHPPKNLNEDALAKIKKQQEQSLNAWKGQKRSSESMLIPEARNNFKSQRCEPTGQDKINELIYERKKASFASSPKGSPVMKDEEPKKKSWIAQHWKSVVLILGLIVACFGSYFTWASFNLAKSSGEQNQILKVESSVTTEEPSNALETSESGQTSTPAP